MTDPNDPREPITGVQPITDLDERTKTHVLPSRIFKIRVTTLLLCIAWAALYFLDVTYNPTDEASQRPAASSSEQQSEDASEDPVESLINPQDSESSTQESTSPSETPSSTPSSPSTTTRPPLIPSDLIPSFLRPGGGAAPSEAEVPGVGE
jgi:cytoskeletal protein RodZ